jgi:hypothetical protein
MGIAASHRPAGSKVGVHGTTGGRKIDRVITRRGRASSRVNPRRWIHLQLQILGLSTISVSARLPSRMAMEWMFGASSAVVVSTLRWTWGTHWG